MQRSPSDFRDRRVNAQTLLEIYTVFAEEQQIPEIERRYGINALLWNLQAKAEGDCILLEKLKKLEKEEGEKKQKRK